MSGQLREALRRAFDSRGNESLTADIEANPEFTDGFEQGWRAALAAATSDPDHAFDCVCDHEEADHRMICLACTPSEPSDEEIERLREALAESADEIIRLHEAVRWLDASDDRCEQALVARGVKSRLPDLLAAHSIREGAR